MKKHLSSFAGAVAVAAVSITGALADGMPSRGKAVAYEAAPAHNWSGLYFGASIGAQWSDVNGTFVGPPLGVHHDSTPDSGIYGGHVGLQHQFGAIVVGVEASVSGTGLFHSWGGGTAGNTAGCLGQPAFATFTCQSHPDMLVTIGSRLGWAMTPSWMAYVTGGYASANLESRTLNAGVQLDTANRRHDGWFIGGGIDWAITPNWILGLEYQHLEFETRFHPSSFGLTESRHMDMTTDVVKAKLSYKIGRAAPAYEPMK